MSKRVTVQFLAERLIDLTRRVKRVERKLLRVGRRRIGFDMREDDAGVVPGDGFKQDPDEGN